jgi:pimeloyl-ACP methyl ester carboxylesterase
LAGSSLGGGIALELGRRGRASAVTAFAPVGFWGPAGRRWCQAVVGGSRALSTALAPALPRLFATRAGRVALCAIFYGHPGRLSTEDCLASARALSRAPGFAAARRAFGVWRLPVGADPGALDGIPVTIAWGTRDVVLPYRRQSARARAELPAARHVRLPGCGHLPFADDPVRCAELLTVRQ